MDKRFLGILAGIVVIFIGIFVLTSHKNNPSSASSSSDQATHHVEGQGKSGVTLVEYGDYECPVCQAYYQPVKAAVNQLSDQIFYQFRNLPLSQIHPNAFTAARAAEAAGLQNKYWQMHDQLYQNQNSWVSSSDPQTQFDQYAKNIGLNIAQFNTDYESSKVNNAINADLAAFAKTGQPEATPTFFLDGNYVANSDLVDSNGNPDTSKFVSVIKAEIAKKQQNK